MITTLADENNNQDTRRPRPLADANSSSETRPVSVDAACRRVLIIDDDVGTTELFARMLRLEGYAVSTALSAETGLQEAEAHPPDAILLDLRMPSVDGLGFLRRLRARHCQTPVAIVTGDSAIENPIFEGLRELGAVIRLKPLWLPDLIVLVSLLLETPLLETPRTDR